MKNKTLAIIDFVLSGAYFILFVLGIVLNRPITIILGASGFVVFLLFGIFWIRWQL